MNKYQSGYTFEQPERVEPTNPLRKYLTMGGLGIAFLFVLILSMSSCNTVDAGEVGLYNRFGQIDNDVAGPGLHFSNPFTTSMEIMNVQSTRYDAGTPVYTQDLQTATVRYTVVYSLQRGRAVEMWRQYNRDWDNRLIPPILESTTKNVFGRFTAMNAVARRPQIQAQILDALRARLVPHGINIESFELRNIDYSDAFEHAVEQAQVATQQAVAARNATVRVEEQARQRVITATSEAEAMRVQANAISTNPAIVQMRAIEKWNGVLPQNMYGGGAIPFVNVGGN